jgi:hypothetical protein
LRKGKWACAVSDSHSRPLVENLGFMHVALRECFFKEGNFPRCGDEMAKIVHFSRYLQFDA